ncbi:MAG: cob(I)yrinic acid a,c-diamide adenosyltransferase [Ignavibacteriales bacterium]|nr:cob(I)yrinic acid a,c-diamide adenosyltransferase [Ignavibacteriales bacterium]
MKIYTKYGDTGKTCLANGKKVWKNDMRVNAYGTVDELNSILGLTQCEIIDKNAKSILLKIQNDLFTLCLDLAYPIEEEKKTKKVNRITKDMITCIENYIDEYESRLPSLETFILPSGKKGASFSHLARTVCRRAEREVVALSRKFCINKNCIVYLNRLSDFLFVLSRSENYISHTPEIAWKK